MQSTAARVTVAVVSVAVIVVLFVLLSGGDEEGGTTTGADVATTTVGTPTEGPDEYEQEPAKPEVPAEPEVPRIEIVDGQPQGGPAELEFSTGDQVRFEVESDIDDEVHVHGYDVSTEVKAGKTARVEFPADIEGVFEVELEVSAVPIAELTVKP